MKSEHNVIYDYRITECYISFLRAPVYGEGKGNGEGLAFGESSGYGDSNNNNSFGAMFFRI